MTVFVTISTLEVLHRIIQLSQNEPRIHLKNRCGADVLHYGDSVSLEFDQKDTSAAIHVGFCLARLPASALSRSAN